MANVENLKKLRDQLSRLPDEKFNMGPIISHHECGTVACIAGWASLLNGGPDDGRALGFASRWLGLTSDEAHALFLGDWHPSGGFGLTRDEITRADAIAELDRMIAAEEPR